VIVDLSPNLEALAGQGHLTCYELAWRKSPGLLEQPRQEVETPLGAQWVMM